MGNISSVLKAKRKELGLTLAQIAEKIGVTEATVQRWESGNIKSLRHERIAKLADILGVTPAVLMGWDEPTRTNSPLPHHHRGHSDISGHHQRSDALRRRIHRRERGRREDRSAARLPQRPESRGLLCYARARRQYVSGVPERRHRAGTASVHHEPLRRDRRDQLRR